MNSSWCFAIFFLFSQKFLLDFLHGNLEDFFTDSKNAILKFLQKFILKFRMTFFLYLQKFIHLHFQIHMDFTRNLRRSSPGVFYEFLLAVMSPRFFSGITYEILVAFYDVSSKNSFWCFFFFSQKFPLSFLQGCLQEFFHGFLQKFIQDF